ncbi:cell wall-binding repeat-containing protein [Lagierella sp.]|uniref:cell wall-binding repeat-containing protein n=1 Tax=Lagierella sp. TaxID=2849657 RepID=UPI00263153DB|nr:cell wall-binding repeat-containing protein [Lagierella sp.]
MKILKKSMAALLAMAMILGSLIPGLNLNTQVSAAGRKRVEISNPYSTVDWDKFDQYKANFHSHTTESDGVNEPYEMIEEHYAQGYDIVAITDHDHKSTTIDRTDTNKTYVSAERKAEMEAGAGRNGRKIVFIPYCNEHSVHDHLNSFWTNTPVNNTGAILEGSIDKAQGLGGITHINHPGRYTGGDNTANKGADGEAASNDPKHINKYLDLFNKYDSLVGMEIINKKDGDSYSDRILWDNLLKESMPKRPIWGFSNDDNHSIAKTGFSYNMMLLPENNEENIRYSMENGTFYAVAKVCHRELGDDFEAKGETPKITNISVDKSKSSITIDAENYNTIQWIADGKVIGEGNSIDLLENVDKINGYVRANIMGDGGIAFTQPFGLKVVEENGPIINPYSDVDWNTFNQYKANFHSHTNESDGGNSPKQMIEHHYDLGYDVIAMTDHNHLFTAIDRTDREKEYVTSERRAEMEAGVDREGRGIYFIENSEEQSRHDHVNTFWTEYTNPEKGANMEESIKQAHELGGISHINHPGRYTGGVYDQDDGSYGKMVSSTPATISKYMNLFNKYDSLVGMEIINKKDGDSFSDRILWDNLLSVSMPNRPIWGFSNDDNHSMDATGFSYNMLLMPENTPEETRYAMESGNFYAVAKVSRRELGRDFKAEGPTPTITNISVDQGNLSISIDAENTDKIQWIADGEVIAEGKTLNINDHKGQIFNYVRANLIGKGGIAFTQPFGTNIDSIKPVEFVELFLDSDDYELDSSLDEKATLDVFGRDTKFEEVSIDLKDVKFHVEDETVVKVDEKGEVTIVTKPEDKSSTKIYATATIDGKEYKSNTIEITLKTPYELPNGADIYAINNGNDDVEENLDTGSMYMDSSDLEIAYDGDVRQEIGLRFNDIKIPAGKKLKEAFVQFATDETKSSKNVDPFNVKISGELTANSKEFIEEDKNVSSRTHTKAEVVWKDIPKWTMEGEAGKAQRTPDLSSIIKEIIGQKDFKSGNSLSIFLSGEGVRCADAFEDKNSIPAKLVLVFEEEETTKPSKPNYPGVPKDPTNPTDSTKPTAPSDVKVETDRIKGQDRYETAIEISKKTFKKADNVILASGGDYPDALTASVLAGMKNAPVLLVNESSLKSVVKELERLEAKNITVVGGKDSVAKDIENTLTGSYKVDRVFGQDRYETAKKVYDLVLSLGGNKEQVIVADGRNYPDALAAGSFGAKSKTPIILAKGDIIPSMSNLPKKAIIVGGKTSVGKAVENLFDKTERIAGKDRYETSVLLAKRFFPESKTIILASGQVYADALTASVLGSTNDYPIILTRRDYLEKSVKDYIAEEKIEKILIVGGKSTISTFLGK